MFAQRYFAPRYFARRYFPGAATALATVAGGVLKNPEPGRIFKSPEPGRIFKGRT